MLYLLCDRTQSRPLLILASLQAARSRVGTGGTRACPPCPPVPVYLLTCMVLGDSGDRDMCPLCPLVPEQPVASGHEGLPVSSGRISRSS